MLGDKTPHPPHPKIAKTARSTQDVVAWQANSSTKEYLQRKRNEGAFLLALEITTESKSLFDFRFPADFVPTAAKPIYLITGNEAHGVAPSLLDICHSSVHLPMHGRNTSMNVSVALGAAVYLLLQHFQ